MFLYLVLLLLNNFQDGTAVKNDSSPVVTTPLGGIKGTYKESFSGRIYGAYEGIPYARAPIKERRFMVNFVYLFFHHSIVAHASLIFVLYLMNRCNKFQSFIY